MTSVCGEEGKLLALLCQPAVITGHVSIPPTLQFWYVGHSCSDKAWRRLSTSRRARSSVIDRGWLPPQRVCGACDSLLLGVRAQPKCREDICILGLV